MQEVCRPHLGIKPCWKQGESCKQTKWVAERSCLYTHCTKESVHTGARGPLQSHPQWFLGGKTHPKVLCPFTRKERPQTAPPFKTTTLTGYTCRTYLWKVPVMTLGLGAQESLCSRKFESFSRRQRKLKILFTAIQKSQSNKYPSAIFISNDPISPEQCWWKGSSL